MQRTLGVILLASVQVVAATAQEVIDPEQAARDPDFGLQGEYAGQGTWPSGEAGKVGAQVIALSAGQFRAVVFRGGLPGAGWKRGDDRATLDGKANESGVSLQGKRIPGGRISGPSLTLLDADGKSLATLKKVQRKSPTLGEKPPADALVLFRGKDADLFTNATVTEMHTLQAGAQSKQKYRVARLHLEFRLSWKPKARGQGRSNSGVFLGGIPEIQVLDSFGLEGQKNECGAFYGRREPDVNMCFPPMTWQTYDVEFTQAAPDQNILATVRHNGVVVHRDYDTRKKQLQARNLSLQAHGNRVQYRNIWLVETTPSETGG